MDGVSKPDNKNTDERERERERVCVCVGGWVGESEIVSLSMDERVQESVCERICASM